MTIDHVKLTVLPANNVETGTNVTLRCEASVSQSLRQSLTYSFSLLQEDQVIISKNITDSVLERTLSPARVSNSGRYQCRVHIRNKQKTSNSVSLTVTGLQVPLLKVKSDIVSEGENIIATCSAPEETGGLMFFFYEDNQEVKRVVHSTNSVTTTLTMQKLTDIYLHCTYMVIMHPSAGVSNKSNIVKVFVQELFSKPILSISPVQVFEGQRFILNCTSNVTSPVKIGKADIKYVLLKDDRPISAAARYEETASLATNGNYSCMAMVKEVNKSSLPLILKAKVPVSIPVLRAVNKVIIGKPFNVSCEAENGTLPIIYTLLKNHARVAYRRVTEAANRAIFNITSISSPEEIYSFTCLAYNRGPSYSMFSEPLTAPVIVPVSKPVMDTKEATVTEGSDLTLNCEVQEGTRPITFTWYHNGVMIPLPTKEDKFSEKHVVEAIKRDQRGDYHCDASNSALETKTSNPIRISDFSILFGNAFFLRKPSRPKSGDPMRVSLTLDIEDNTALNGTPCVMGRNVWSEHASGSDSDDHTDEDSKLVQPQEVDPSRDDPVKKSLEPEYSVQHTEVQMSTPGGGKAVASAGMKYSYQYPVSQYTRSNTHYTPTHYTPSHYSSSSYSPGHYSSTKYSPTTHHTPSYYTPPAYTPAYKPTSTYTPVYSKVSRQSSSPRTSVTVQHTPTVTLKPARAVRFTNDVVFQDLVRHSELEQIGRFMRARKVRLDTIFHSGMAALHEAVLSGNLECVKLLIKYGADVHQRDENGWTPLHMACSDGYPEIARSSAPRMHTYKRTSSPRSPTNSGEPFTPAHEENVRFIHDTWLCVLRDIKSPQNSERNDRGPQEYVEKNPNPNLHSFIPVDLSDLKKRNTQDSKKS
ncbi:platelet endothelial cell adhesion molecule-like protein [Labeo rohita]|uniref:Platelet endothelial cell adhesion molecule-like protein n=1 Tax=Labeo rohita TaxID=84645 RepID=A0A498NC29_LABRO|nr:platelet endothelial cell adhesion molecule-like protein [Labeo rohita]